MTNLIVFKASCETRSVFNDLHDRLCNFNKFLMLDEMYDSAVLGIDIPSGSVVYDMEKILNISLENFNPDEYITEFVDEDDYDDQVECYTNEVYNTLYKMIGEFQYKKDEGATPIVLEENHTGEWVDGDYIMVERTEYLNNSSSPFDVDIIFVDNA